MTEQASINIVWKKLKQINEYSWQYGNGPIYRGPRARAKAIRFGIAQVNKAKKLVASTTEKG